MIRPSATAEIGARIGWQVGRDTLIDNHHRHYLFDAINGTIIPLGARGGAELGLSNSRNVLSNGIVTEESLDDLFKSNVPGATIVRHHYYM